MGMGKVSNLTTFRWFRCIISAHMGQLFVELLPSKWRRMQGKQYTCPHLVMRGKEQKARQMGHVLEGEVEVEEGEDSHTTMTSSTVSQFTSTSGLVKPSSLAFACVPTTNLKLK